MPIVIDHNLQRKLNHDHTGQLNVLYLLKAGDTATGTIVLPLTSAQGNALIASINAATTDISAQRISLWHRTFFLMGA